MSKIAIFGGSFNPVHHGHRQVVEEVLGRGVVDEVWLLPVGNHAFGKALAPAKNRLEMLELFIQNLSAAAGASKGTTQNTSAAQKIKICDYELSQEVSFTYETLQYLRATYPQHDFVFLMGGDQLVNFSQWRDYKKLANEFKILVYPRLTQQNLAEQAALCQQYVLHFLTDFPVIAISSTNARAAAADPTQLTALLGESIADYIIKHKLY